MIVKNRGTFCPTPRSYKKLPKLKTTTISHNKKDKKEKSIGKVNSRETQREREKTE